MTVIATMSYSHYFQPPTLSKQFGNRIQVFSLAIKKTCCSARNDMRQIIVLPDVHHLFSQGKKSILSCGTLIDYAIGQLSSTF